MFLFSGSYKTPKIENHFDLLQGREKKQWFLGKIVVVYESMELFFSIIFCFWGFNFLRSC